MTHRRRAASVGDHERTRTGFTLVELLVVIAIIALLIAILLPSLRYARKHAKEKVCQSNLRQLGIAWQAYFDDHMGGVLQRGNAHVAYGGQQGIPPQFRRPKPLNRYLNLPLVAGPYRDPDPDVRDTAEHRQGDLQVFECPSDSGSKLIRPSAFRHYGTSYITNYMIIGQLQFDVPTSHPCADLLEAVKQRLPDQNYSKFHDPAKLILMGDFGWANEARYDAEERIDWHTEACSYNVAFADGHVGFVKIKKGIFVSSAYNIIPFRDLIDDANACQVELPCD